MEIGKVDTTIHAVKNENTIIYEKEKKSILPLIELLKKPDMTKTVIKLDTEKTLKEKLEELHKILNDYVKAEPDKKNYNPVLPPVKPKTLEIPNKKDDDTAQIIDPGFLKKVQPAENTVFDKKVYNPDTSNDSGFNIVLKEHKGFNLGLA